MSPIKKFFATAAIAAGTFAAAVPAQAVVTTFASFSALSSARNVRFINAGNASNRTSDGAFYTISNNGGTTPGTVNVRFSFLQPGLGAFVQNVVAAFTLNATVARNTPVTGNPFTQLGLSGTFSFISTTGLTVNNTFYAAGSNLLSASFGGADITGTFGGTSGASSASTLGGAFIAYTSDFLDFSNTVSRDFGITMTSVNFPFQKHAGPNGALNAFRANAGGQFSSDPAPIINAVIPEPAVWGLMVVGFGLVGLQVRRRKSVLVSA